MATLREIKHLKELAEELKLENREILGKYKLTELASIYNGIGPDCFPEWLRSAISSLHPSLAVVAFIHDVEWHESDLSMRSSPNRTLVSKRMATWSPRRSFRGSTRAVIWS